MTLIETCRPKARMMAPPGRGRVLVDGRGKDSGRADIIRTRPAPARPGGAPLRYRGSGVTMSRASHRRRPVTPTATIGLALLAALITVGLGLVAQFGALAAGRTAAVPDQLGVVRVQDGEGLAQLATRVAPGASAGQVVVRIRELNGLHSAALDAGQTLVVPIG